MEIISKPISPTVLNYYEEIESKCAPIFYEMQRIGVRIDLEYLRDLKEHLEDIKQPLEEDIKNELGSINLSSPKQLLEALHAKEIYPELKGKPSTDKRALDRLKNTPTVSKLLAYSEIDTLLSAFVCPYLGRDSEVVHPYFNQVGTRTGRPSCSNPNLLQIPKRTENGRIVRKMFIARERHVFGDSDYSSIEPRLMAHLSKDPVMCEMFNSGTDFHTFTSKRMGIDRDRAKVLNLSVGYRATFKSVSNQLRCTDTEAQTEIDKWWGMFPKLRLWQQEFIWKTRKHGYFETLKGRRIYVDNLNETNKWKREGAERQLINNLCQASAAEVMKLGMIKTASRSITMLVQVYDALLTEHPESRWQLELEATKECMETAIKLDVPLVVESKYGPNWAEVEKL